MKKIFIAILSLVLLGSGCENIDFGDTNENANGPSDPNTAALLSGAMTSYSTQSTQVLSSLYVQYLVNIVYHDEMLYADAFVLWTSYYVPALSNLETVIAICSDPENANNPLILTNGAPENQVAVAMIFKSVIFKRITDLFGDIPFSEALDQDELTPAYDDQKDIYTGLITDVKAARDMIHVDKAGATGDVIYLGDMTMWQKFANSFLVCLGMQLTKADFELAEATVKEALGHSSGVLEDIREDAVFTFDVPNGFNNPLSEIRPADYGVSAEFISALKGMGFTSNSTPDERILYIASDTALNGFPYGWNSYTGINSPIAEIMLAPDTKFPLLTSAYVYLHRAEAAARGWTDEDAGDMLKAGIMNSYSRGTMLYGFDIGDGMAYADARVADMSTAPGGELQVIGEEKWVALFPLGYNTWSEWRRTGYPELIPARDAINDGQIPRRFSYPYYEVALNSDGYSSGVSSLSPATDNNTSRIWWDQ